MRSSTYNLRNRIMKRIFGIWFLRHTMPLVILELIGLFVALSFFTRLVFVEKVVSNALTAAVGNPFKLFTYLVSAFLGSEFTTQAVIVILLAVVILVLRDLNRSLIAYLVMKRNQLTTETVSKI